jgi:hypothetical protein
MKIKGPAHSGSPLDRKPATMRIETFALENLEDVAL